MCLDLPCNPHLFYGAVPDGAEHIDALDLDVASILEYRNGLVDSVGAQAAKADSVQVKYIVCLECACLQVEAAADCNRGIRDSRIPHSGIFLKVEILLEPGHCRAVYAIPDNAGTPLFPCVARCPCLAVDIAPKGNASNMLLFHEEGDLF